MSDHELLRLVYRHLDLRGLQHERAELTRDQVDAFFRRLAACLPPPAVASRAAPPTHAAADPPGWATVYTDGASKGNPGPAGAGFVILDAAGHRLAHAGRSLGIMTNNQAEYHAVIDALTKARRLGLTHLRLRADSQLLIRQVKGEYKVRNPGIAPLFAQVQSLVRQFTAFRCEHIPREQNRDADLLASDAARQL